MMIGQQVYAQALLLAGQLEQRQSQLLQVLCSASVSSLTSRLRDGIAPEDCKADFIAAASLYALAALGDAEDTVSVEEFQAGDLSIRKGSTARDTASRCLERQADMMIAPYLKDRFSFMGV